MTLSESGALHNRGTLLNGGRLVEPDACISCLNDRGILNATSAPSSNPAADPPSRRGLHGDRARGLIAVLWRAGLRIQEALDLNELDLDRRRGSVLVRCGKGGRRG